MAKIIEKIKNFFSSRIVLTPKRSGGEKAAGEIKHGASPQEGQAEEKK